MNNILVTGSNGQLGSELRALVSNVGNDNNFIFSDADILDITMHAEVEKFINANNINTIINCAAYTAVDKAEEQVVLANKVNHLAVANFAKLAKHKNIKLVHISTDYVFDGTNHKPYLESDIPHPKSVYGQTKLDGEQAILSINPENTIIIRTSWVYSIYGNNFVKTMLRLGKERDEISVVSDQIGTPTNAADLAQTILSILPKINNESVEIFHYSNEGVCSWYDFAKAIFMLSDLDIKLFPIVTDQYPTPAQRPYYSVMNKNKIKEAYQIEIPFWRDSLSNIIK